MSRMSRDDIKSKLQEREFGSDDLSGTLEDEDVSVVSASLPNITAPRMRQHRRTGFWPELIERCRRLPVSQAVKVRLLPEETSNNFMSTARSVARGKGFYLNTVYKYPFVYLWPDRMRGRILPEDRNTQGATFFEDEQEVK